MNSNKYKFCMVPECRNTSIKCPDKLFICLPKDKKMRYKWCKLSRRDPRVISPNTPLYFCEDHFDLPNDMENYIQYRVMGSVSRIRMKPGCIPTNFECQPDRRKRSSNTTERLYIIKKRRKELIEESLRDAEERNNSSILFELGETSTKNSDLLGKENITEDEQVFKTANKAIQVYMTHKFRSKAIQTGIILVNQMTSPLKPNLHSVSTSPFTTTRCTTKPSTSTVQMTSRRIFAIEDQPDGDINFIPSQTNTESSTTSIQAQTSDCSEVMQQEKKQEESKILECTLFKIMKNPRSYLGVQKSCLFLIDLLQQTTSIPTHHILMCLKKIRLNNSYRELADDFSVTPTYASKIFLKNIPVLASLMCPFIVELHKESIKKNLPMAFRHRYNHVSCIIDCLEIEVQKSSKAVNQSVSWSEYKKAHTMKYLVSCTPNGLVNYISPGYSGRITDTVLVEVCDFVKSLQPGMCVLADRGFKHVQVYLQQQGVKLIRPPSVSTGVKLSKSEVREAKQIASLRIHIERVIRRIREFHMLKPHACLNNYLLKVLDEVIVIACGLINLQDSLIK